MSTVTWESHVLVSVSDINIYFFFVYFFGVCSHHCQFTSISPGVLSTCKDVLFFWLNVCPEMCLHFICVKLLLHSQFMRYDKECNRTTTTKCQNNEEHLFKNGFLSILWQMIMKNPQYDTHWDRIFMLIAERQLYLYHKILWKKQYFCLLYQLKCSFSVSPVTSVATAEHFCFSQVFPFSPFTLFL